MRQCTKYLAAFVAGVTCVFMLGAAMQQQPPTYPRYQVAPWGDSDTLVVLDNEKNEVHVLFQEYSEVGQNTAPWRTAGKINLDEAVRTPSTRYKQGLVRPHVTSQWRK